MENRISTGPGASSLPVGGGQEPVANRTLATVTSTPAVLAAPQDALADSAAPAAADAGVAVDRGIASHDGQTLNELNRMRALAANLQRGAEGDESALESAALGVGIEVTRINDELQRSGLALWGGDVPEFEATRAQLMILADTELTAEGITGNEAAMTELTDATRKAGKENAQEAVSQSLHAGYQDVTEDLEIFASKLNRLNETKRDLRDRMKGVRDALLELAGQPEDAKLDPPMKVDGKTFETKAELEAHLENLEGDLATAGDDAQLAMVDLQSAMQRQQRFIEMMANLQKMAHETAMAILRNMN